MRAKIAAGIVASLLAVAAVVAVAAWKRDTTYEVRVVPELSVRIFDPSGHARTEVTSRDFILSATRAHRYPGTSAGLNVSLTHQGALKLHRLTRSVALRGARLHRSQTIGFAVNDHVYSQPLIEYREFPNGLDGTSAIQIALPFRVARRLAREMRRASRANRAARTGYD